MFGLRASAIRLRERIANARGQTDGPGSSPNETAALIAHAVYHRETAGQTTSLRQIHVIANISQPEAMRCVHDLESSGMVMIEHNIDDALESRVFLTARMRAQLEKILRRNAA